MGLKEKTKPWVIRKHSLKSTETKLFLFEIHSKTRGKKNIPLWPYERGKNMINPP